MAQITKETIDNIRTSSDIVEVIGSYINLTSKGKNYFGVCPFHDDHSPSMSVSVDKQIYTCFSCGATGNVISFVMNYEKVSFFEALKILGDKSGIKIDSSEIKKPSKYQELYNIYNTAVLFYKNNLYTKFGHQALEYLYDRGLDDETIKYFDIGVSTNNSLTKILSEKTEKNILVDIGLSINKEDEYHDLFKNRIMFPIKDNEGNFVAFSGRIYNIKSDSKYVNTKETLIFKKGNILYNYKNALEFIKRDKEIILCEGFMDTIRLHSIGIKNSVALMGTSLTNEMLHLINNLKVKVVLNLDKDEAGNTATLKIGEELLKLGIETSVIVYEGAKDSDEYVVKFGKESFLSVYKNKVSYIDFKTNYLKQQINKNDAVSVSKYINQMIESLNKINDQVLRELKVNELANEFGLNPSTIMSKIKTPEKIVVKTAENIVKPKKYNKYILSEMRIIYLMLNYPEVLIKYEKNLGYMPDENMRMLANEILYFKTKNKYFDYADFISSIIEKEELNKTLIEVNESNNIETYTNEELEDYFNTIREKTVQNKLNELKIKLKATLDIEEKKRIISKIEKMKKDVSKW